MENFGPMISRLHMKIKTNSNDENSVLVLSDGYLVAIVVRLDDPTHGSAQGRWHLEAHFDHVPDTDRLFGDLDEAVAWVAAQTENMSSRRSFAD
jgi:hypothetical protein